MSAPVRIQRKRVKGWRMPEGAVYVGRPSAYGNPYRTNGPNPTIQTPAELVAAFRALFDHAGWAKYHMDLTPLRGRDLCCWCALDQPCHADVLLEIANSVGGGSGTGSKRNG